jgi:peptidoglycan/xylan/chitin deacetylase (PgdA/CDA1 family)
MSITASIRKILRPFRAVVLMYHRIAEPILDPWQLSVSRFNFASHIEFLMANYSVVRVSELVPMIRGKKLDKDVVCITFDDGYEDNFLYALPVLEQYSCPATFFISTGNIGSNEPYWWDTLTEIFLITNKLPPDLEIKIGEKKFTYCLDNDGLMTDEDFRLHTSWFWPNEPPTQRCKIYLEIWMHLRDLPSFTIRQTVKRLMEWAAFTPANNCGSFPMSRSELISMFQSTWAEAGIHTVNHPALASFPKQLQESEILGCKEYLEENLGSVDQFIAFPYGNYNGDTLDALNNAKLQAAFTTEARPVSARSDVFQLGRFQVTDQTAEDLCKHLKMWFNQ